MIENKSKDNNLSKKDNSASEPSNDNDLLDKVEALPEEQRQEMKQTLEMYSGPIPHPKILEGYEKLDHGAAKEIIDNGVEESQHRRRMETKRQARRGHLAWATLLCLTIIVSLFMIGSFYLILNSHEIIGTIFGGGSFLTLLGSWVDQVPMLTEKDDLSGNDTNRSDDKK
jgi:uncharacterized membrane protein